MSSSTTTAFHCWIPVMSFSVLARSIIISQFLIEMTTRKRSGRRCICHVLGRHSPEFIIYLTTPSRARRGLLIDPGAASGLVGSDTLRDLMAWCISEEKREDHAMRKQKTSVAGISKESDQTLGEASLKLPAANRAISSRGDVLGRAGSLCPTAWKPNSSSTSSPFQWFPNGDGLLTIHSREMLKPDGQTILLQLLLTDFGHHLLRSGNVNVSHSLQLPLTILFVF